MKTVNYKTLSMQYIIGYFRQNKDIVNLLKMIPSRYSELQNCLRYLLNTLSITNARGIWLDYVGNEVGTVRDEVSYGDFFCLNTGHINASRKFYFLSSGSDPRNPVTLEDREFIQKIRAHILGNSSSGTIEEIISVIKLIVEAENVLVSAGNNGGIKINIAGSNLILTTNTIKYIQQILGSGIYLEEVTTNGTTN